MEFLVAFTSLGLLLYLTISITGAIVFTRIRNRLPEAITPAHFGLQFEDINFPAAKDKLTIRGWFVPARSERVVLVVHGLGANRADVLEPAVALAKSGFNLLLIDLRGHGSSDGKVCSYGYFEQRDVLGALAYLKKRGFQQVGVLSYSMGASTSLMVMSYTPEIKALVADSAFAHLGRELRHAFTYATGGRIPKICLPGMLLMARLLRGIKIGEVRPEEAVRKLNGRRLLLIHGDSDLLVPPENIQKLKEAAGDTAQTWIIKGAGHVGSYYIKPQQYVNRLLTFFQTEL